MTTVMLAVLAGSAMGQVSYTETFAGGVNAGGWTLGAPIEQIEPTGGVTGEYLHGSQLDTTIPFLRTAPGVSSVFTGNYRARSAQTLRLSLRVNATDFSVSTFRPAAILYSENGTPGNTDDDWGVYALAPNILGTPGTWRAYLFSVHSLDTTLPPEWTFIPFGPNAPAAPNWNALVQSVDRLMFSFGDPSLFYIFQMWDVGVDDIQVFGMPPCYGNCDGSTSPPILNVLDFTCFLNRFAAGDTRANCDGSQTPPVLNVLDFGCFLSAFAAGCS